MDKRAFISHISDEAGTAMALKEAFVRDFLGMLAVYVSSDAESISVGEPWFESVEKALTDCEMLIILCSPKSVDRPWINFEAGAAWMRKIPLIPVCHAGMSPTALPMPLSSRQAILLEDPSGLRRLYTKLAEIIGCKVPPHDFAALAAELGGTKAAGRNSPAHGAGKTDRITHDGLREALNHPKLKWRTLRALALASGVSEQEAADLLRGNAEVRFGVGKSGNVIAGLKSRVGEQTMIRKR